ncbi:hypothetical protein [Marinobacter sp. X15-166B]|uniref:hypothetical protein n=1 Tax=Marinobacter sp. X15-166B TaxID=1897620 RepID=UPI00085BB47B|nr:hypothetical protein [Marinobacter sp. X15-166B]OEY66817.1 hypothetical protein BG841_10365 [Marinobacter sp. X15-166B]
MNTRGETSDDSGFTDEQIEKTTAFFARIVTIYGRSRAKTLWGDSADQFRLMRREWAGVIGSISLDQAEVIFARLKDRLATGDPEYKWPDVPKIIGLAKSPQTNPAHKEFAKALPEPEWRKEQRRQVGLLASQTAMAVMRGKASFIEDRRGQ